MAILVDSLYRSGNIGKGAKGKESIYTGFGRRCRYVAVDTKIYGTAGGHIRRALRNCGDRVPSGEKIQYPP